MHKSHTENVIQAYEQGGAQSADDESCAHRHQMDFAVHVKNNILHKARIKGKGAHATTLTQWQIVVPKELQPQAIQAYHTCKQA